MKKAITHILFILFPLAFIISLLYSCYIERDIKVWNQTLCLERVRTVYRGDKVYYDHVWTDGKIRYTERREDSLKVGDCKTFLVR